MTYLDLIKNLKSGKLDNFYLLKGEDYFVVKKAKEKIIETSGIELEELNLISFDCDSFSINSFLTAAMGLPVMSERKIVLLLDINPLSEGDKLAIKNNFKKNEQTIIICIQSRKDFEDFGFLEDCRIVECSKLSLDIIKNYVLKICKNHNTQITEPAFNLLVDLCNFSMTRINTEIEKLCLICGDGKIINDDLVSSCVAKEIEYEVFALTNALAEKKEKECLIVLNNLLAKKEEPQGIFALMAGTIRRMLLVQISQGLDDSEIAKQLGVKEFAVKKARESASKFPLARLREIARLFEEVDGLVKRGQMPFDLALNYIILSVCQK